jgi:hypothetical protein
MRNISKSGDMAWETADVVLQFDDDTKSQARVWGNRRLRKDKWRMEDGSDT